MNYRTEYIKACPELGYNYGFVIAIPEKINESKTVIAEMNNTGMISNEDEILKSVVSSIGGDNVLNSYRDSGYIVVIPLFPRFEYVYTHALSRIVLMTEEQSLLRIDMQFANMMKSAVSVLKNLNIDVDEKFILSGFSAAGAFSNRFALMHPSLLKGVISGGLTFTIMPFTEIEKNPLTYPLGISDLKELTGIEFDVEAYKKLPQLIYEGDTGVEYTDETIWIPECIEKQQAELLYSLFGNESSSKRRENQYKFLRNTYPDIFENVIFKVFYGQGHVPHPNNNIWFIENNCLSFEKSRCRY